MIVLVPLELTEYDYEYNNDPRNTLHAAGPLAHRRGYSGRSLLSQGSPVALVFTTPALHALGLSAEPYQVSSVIQWQVFHTRMCFRLSPFGAPVPFPPWARTLRRVACEIAAAAAAVRSPAPPALLTGDLVSDALSGIFAYVSSYVSTAAFGWALDSLAGSRFVA